VNIRRRKVRTLLAALAVVLPGGARRFVHCRLLGYRIARSAHVGHSFIDVDRLRMDSGSRIGSLTVIRGCEDVELGEGAAIGPLNLINAVPQGSRFFSGQKRHPAVILGRGAAITTMHFVDASDTVTVSDFSYVGGAGSQILTHSIDLVRLRQSTSPIVIGHHSLVGTASVLLPGAAVPECSLVAAGSVVTKSSTPHAYRVYGGVPVQVKRELDPNMKAFRFTGTEIL
jgi:acetyltransferase-like isoleucine patch superfamily enzyme